jgi:hypothetical protein
MAFLMTKTKTPNIKLIVRSLSASLYNVTSITKAEKGAKLPQSSKMTSRRHLLVELPTTIPIKGIKILTKGHRIVVIVDATDIKPLSADS